MVSRIMANSAGDWGPSNPMNIPDLIRALKARGHDGGEVHKIAYANPLRFMSQARRFDFTPPVPLP